MQGSSHEEMKETQDRREKPIMQGEDQQQHHQPQKCPRCESLNTKFCYYNNYNLSQPRYFCKTCRRYWTLGGTLRNVPVGGGCRRGKRAKTSVPSPSSGENSRSQSQPQHNLSPLQSIISNANSGSATSPALRDRELSGNLVSSAVIPSYFPGGGFVASVAAINPPIINQPPQGFSHHSPYHQPMNLVADLSGSSNLSLLHGFTSIPSFVSQQNQQVQQERQLYRADDGRENKSIEHPLQPHEGSLVQPDRSACSSHNQQNWHQQGFIANSDPTISDTALWSICTNTTQGSSDSNDPPSGSTCLNPDHQWRGIPGYGPPP